MVQDLIYRIVKFGSSAQICGRLQGQLRQLCTTGGAFESSRECCTGDLVL